MGSPVPVRVLAKRAALTICVIVGASACASSARKVKTQFAAERSCPESRVGVRKGVMPSAASPRGSGGRVVAGFGRGVTVAGLGVCRTAWEAPNTIAARASSPVDPSSVRRCDARSSAAS